jgi:protein-L-isoaspartate(D-aspartate) O-methyltransferase
VSDKDIELAELLRTLGVTHPQVLAAIAQVSRQVYVEPDMQAHAYDNQALPINCGQTISQPYVVAYMSALALGDKQQLGKVLEIGTGSGYQAAILSELADEVYSVERIEQSIALS